MDESNETVDSNEANEKVAYNGDYADLEQEIGFAKSELHCKHGQYINAVANLRRLRDVARDMREANAANEITAALEQYAIVTITYGDDAPEKAKEAPVAAKATRKPRATRKAPQTAASSEETAAPKRAAKIPKDGTTKKRIYDAVAAAGVAVTAKIIAENLGLGFKAVGPILCHMVKDGLLRKGATEGYEVNS